MKSPAPAAGGDVRALHVCYFGLNEPLVQTQVLPYLRELAASGVTMSLLTFEPDLARRWTPPVIAERKEALRQEGIDWHLLPYHKRPSLPATAWDIVAGTWVAARIARRHGIHIVHGRSHVGAAVGVLAKLVTSARVIFDIRGFLAEEYVEKGRWKAGGSLFVVAKAAERWLYRFSDGFVVLTESARRTLFPCGPPANQPVELIPCCVDMTRFAPHSMPRRNALRAELGLSKRLVFVYAGTTGGAYLTGETAAFLAAARDVNRQVYALILAQDGAAPLVAALAAAGFSADDYRVVSAHPRDVPRYLHAADVGLLPARSTFSARSQSPTKFAEYLAAGLPVLATAGIGDLDVDIEANRVGVRLRSLDREAYLSAFRALDQLRHDPGLSLRCRSLVHAKYDLHAVGGPRYRRLYDAVLERCARRAIRVVALASYPCEAASTRYRIGQYIEPLAQRGIDIRLRPFLDVALFRRLYRPSQMLVRLPRVVLRALGSVGTALRCVHADVVFVQREAMLFGPPVIERIAVRLLRRPLVLDLDDATYISYRSPVYGRLATALKWPGKTDTLIRWAHLVTCGNSAIAAHARSKGAEAVIVPTALDPAKFRPAVGRTGIPVVGWIGTPSTAEFVERLFPVLQRLAQTVGFRLLIVGAQPAAVHLAGVDVDVREWELSQDAENFRSIDVGVYPLPEGEWSAAKSGLKAVHYMMCGIASVISPVGVCATLGVVGQTHLTAVSDDDWHDALHRLVSNADVRSRMGRAAREFAERHYAIDRQADALADIMRAAVGRSAK